jgi:hypothetical protein
MTAVITVVVPGGNVVHQFAPLPVYHIQYIELRLLPLMPVALVITQMYNIDSKSLFRRFYICVHSKSVFSFELVDSL